LVVGRDTGEAEKLIEILKMACTHGLNVSNDDALVIPSRKDNTSPGRTEGSQGGSRSVRTVSAIANEGSLFPQLRDSK
jgi:hypothetical protein